MKRFAKISQIVLTFIFAASLSLQGIHPAAAQDGTEPRKGRNAHTGKLSFIGAPEGRPLVVRGAQAPGLSQRDRALAMVQPYAADFGLGTASRELAVESARTEKGREITRFQQTYQGIPVMGGELMVNATDRAGLLSINGEIAPDLSVDVNPKITAEQARQAAIEALVKSQGGKAGDYVSSQPTLWIYDSRLMEPDGIQPGLVWRMDVRARDGSKPIDELVLVDAQRGNVRLSFNQIDTTWSGGAGQSPSQEPGPTPTPVVTEEPPVDPGYTPTPEAPAPVEPARDPSLPAATWYVSNSGSDSNSCSTIAAPCLTIQHAVNLAAAGDTIKVASGTYTYAGTGNSSPNVLIVGKSLAFLGGWAEDFAAQTATSVIDGEYGIAGTGHNNNGLLVNNTSAVVSLDHFVIQNGTSADGGGVYLYGSNTTFSNSAIRANHAGRGAGILVVNSTTLTLINTTISGNSASGAGSGIYMYGGGGAVTIQNSTIAYNAGNGGLSNQGVPLAVHNTILAQNGSYDCSGTIGASDHNIIGSTTGCTVSAGTGDQFNVDPQLESSLSGDPPLHLLLAGSPAINAGTSTNCPATDAQGRPRPQGAACDIGAHEFASPGPAASVVLSSGSPQTAIGSHVFTKRLRATVRDATGLPVGGQDVTFTAPTSGASGTFAGSGTNVAVVTADSSGLAISPMFTANSVPGSYTVQASAAGAATTAQFQMENLLQVATTITVQSGTPQEALPSTAFAQPLSVLVKDQVAAPMAGVSVTFTAPTSGASGTFALSGSNTTSVLTDANGIAAASTFSANETEGEYTVDAAVDGITLPAEFHLRNILRVPTTITMESGSLQIAEVSTVFSQPLKALVKDQLGDPLANASVTFTAPDSGASGTFAASASNTTVVSTDGSGVATASVFTANDLEGNYTVQASVSGVGSPAEFELENVVLAPTTIAVSSGSPQFANLSISFAQPLKAVVRDQLGHGIPGIEVSFTAPASGASGTFLGSGSNLTTATTDGTGVATAASFTANALGGAYMVEASTSGVADPAEFKLANWDGHSWYVSTTGSNSNSCKSAWETCATVDGAHTKAAASDHIYVAGGTYVGWGYEYIVITKSMNLSGGWNSQFTLQDQETIIDGGAPTTTVLVVRSSGLVTLDHFTLQNGSAGLSVSSGTVTLTDSFLKHNTVGIKNSGQVTLTNVTSTQNTGDGVWNMKTMSIVNSTITGNAKGILSNSYSLATTTIANSILAGNGGAAGPAECDIWFGSITSGGHNLIGSTAGCTMTTLPSDMVGMDPGLSPLQPGGYYMPLNTGPAVDAADGAICPAMDQRGTARPQGGGCDIGSIESLGAGTTPADLVAYGGTPQTVWLGQVAAHSMEALVIDATGAGVPGIDVAFTAPTTGASGGFSGSGTGSVTVVTDEDGIATAPAFTVNLVPGDNIVTASVSGLGSTASFAIFNYGGFYVAPGGSDSNSCKTPVLACLTINGAITKAPSGDPIKIAAGTYTGSGAAVATIAKNISISGGWDNTFTLHSGQTLIDGQNARPGIQVNAGANVTLADVNIVNGYSVHGGGINNQGILVLTGVTVANNRATDDGGGIYQVSGQLALTNTTISNNTARTSGGGIYVQDGTVNVVNSTIAQNVVSDANVITPSMGGGLSNFFNKPVTITNTIIAGNGAAAMPDCRGIITSGGHNLIGDKDGCGLSSGSGDLAGILGSPLDAKLGNLSNNGGSTFTHALLWGSPAVNAGLTSACPATDQRGVTRPQGPTCDIGAYEGVTSQYVSAIARMYTSHNAVDLPGNFLCDQTAPDCTGGIDPQADRAERYALQVADFYRMLFGRDGIDNNNMPIVSSVHFDTGYDNAFWSGAQMVYGDAHGFAYADDVIGHELTHGVTQYESGLFYYYQSGAINESLSDIFGELYDQSNGWGTDTPEAKWLLGEDVTGLGAIRSMSNPPAYLDPDWIESGFYDESEADNGGVHTNSGVNNKAAYLLVDGGAFNGKTVTALGANKTLAIYYEAQTHLLLSGSDYGDLYYILPQACQNLVGGTWGISAADCQEVQDAVDAVKMNGEPAAYYNRDAPICNAGYVPSNAFYDDFESGTSNWWLAAPRWQLDSPYGAFAHSGLHFLYADDYPPYVSDVAAMMTTGVVVPANAYLHFAQAYDFEHYLNDQLRYDGGVLEYTTDNGANWIDAGPLMDYGGYGGGITALYDNPLGGRLAFVGTSHGYISTRVNLSSLAGQTVRFMWRMGLDSVGVGLGWWLDDVRIYTCVVPTGAISGNTGIANATLSYDDGGAKTALSDGGGNYSFPVSNNWSGIVTPSKPGVIFTPSHNHYSNVISNQTAQNYVAHRTRADFDGNSTSDLSVWRPATGVWYVKNQFNTTWGAAGDVPVPGDYNGDGHTDVAIWHPADGVFYVRGLFNSQWGMAGDIPVPGHYNSDSITDIAIWRPATATWYVKGLWTTVWGQNGDVPVPADYNGDGITDLAVYRPSTGVWYVKNQFNTTWGLPGDIPLPGDYNGDGHADVAVYRPSTGIWYVKGLFNSAWGSATDIPVPADYNADGTTDIAIWRPATATWYVKGQFTSPWGSNGDYPLVVPDTNGDGDPYQ